MGFGPHPHAVSFLDSQLQPAAVIAPTPQTPIFNAVLRVNSFSLLIAISVIVFQNQISIAEFGVAFKHEE